jgi:hypothetical protein
MTTKISTGRLLPADEKKRLLAVLKPELNRRSGAAYQEQPHGGVRQLKI